MPAWLSQSGNGLVVSESTRSIEPSFPCALADWTARGFMPAPAESWLPSLMWFTARGSHGLRGWREFRPGDAGAADQFPEAGGRPSGGPSSLDLTTVSEQSEPILSVSGQGFSPFLQHKGFQKGNPARCSGILSQKAAANWLALLHRPRSIFIGIATRPDPPCAAP